MKDIIKLNKELEQYGKVIFFKNKIIQKLIIILRSSFFYNPKICDMKILFA